MRSGFMRGTEGTAALESALSNTSENTRVRAFAAETLAHRHRRGSHAGGTLGVGAVGAFDGAIEFGGAGQHEPVQTALQVFKPFSALFLFLSFAFRVLAFAK